MEKIRCSYCGGKSLLEHDLETFWSHLGVKRELPDFKFNLFIQAKRSYSVVRIPEILKEFSRTNNWCKFTIENQQQVILKKISEAFKEKALVVYAALIFNTINCLYDYVKNNIVVENSIFCEIERLHGHKTLFFNKDEQVACSKPERLIKS